MLAFVFLFLGGLKVSPVLRLIQCCELSFLFSFSRPMVLTLNFHPRYEVGQLLRACGLMAELLYAVMYESSMIRSSRPDSAICAKRCGAESYHTMLPCNAPRPHALSILCSTLDPSQGDCSLILSPQVWRFTSAFHKSLVRFLPIRHGTNPVTSLRPRT